MTTTRTNRVTLNFRHPFSLKGVDHQIAPGQYEVVTDEELVQELSFPVYRRVATLIFLPTSASIEMVNVDAADLAAAHARDSATLPAERANLDTLAGGQHVECEVVTVRSKRSAGSPTVK